MSTIYHMPCSYCHSEHRASTLEDAKAAADQCKARYVSEALEFALALKQRGRIAARKQAGVSA